MKTAMLHMVLDGKNASQKGTSQKMEDSIRPSSPIKNHLTFGYNAPEIPRVG